MQSRFVAYLQLIRLDKPIGVWLTLWPALWALWIVANGAPSQKSLIVFALGAWVMRSAGCAINDFADYRFDGQVKRTQHRPLATGAISRIEALIIFCLLSAIAIALLWQLSVATRWMAIPAALLAASYPFSKRVLPFPQLILGIAFAWSVPMAFIEESGGLPWQTWVVLLAVVLWTFAFDTEYAMVDSEDDAAIGIGSSALWLGQHDRITIFICQVSALMLLAWVGHSLAYQQWFFAGLLLALIHSAYQQWLIRDRDPAQCFKAFLSNAWFGAIVFFAIALDRLYAAL